MEKPDIIYIAQTSEGVLSVVNEHYPGATEYRRAGLYRLEKEETEKVTKFYTPLEQHNNGSWWFHRLTFRNKQDALEYVDKAISWRDSHQVVIEHKTRLIDETLWTRDFDKFYWAGSTTIVACKAGLIRVVKDVYKKAESQE